MINKLHKEEGVLKDKCVHSYGHKEGGGRGGGSMEGNCLTNGKMSYLIWARINRIPSWGGGSGYGQCSEWVAYIK